MSSLPTTLVRPLSYRRRLLSAALLAILAVVMALSASVPANAAAGSFDDVVDSVHQADIEHIAELDITRGCNPPVNDRFCPDSKVTRGQMAAFLSRAMDLGAAKSAGFVDVEASVFTADIDRLAQAGITRGCNPPANDRYCPDSNVTRGEMAAFLVRAFDLEKTNVDYFPGDDASVFEDDINALAAAGITVGCSASSFCAEEAVTRAQMASFLKRGLTGGGTPISPPPTTPTDPPSELPPPGDSQPPGSVTVRPGDNLASMVSSHPKNTTFYLTSGTHRLQSVVPKDGNEFVGAPGAIMSGAKVLTNFQSSGSFWVVSGQTQQNENHGTCIDGYSGCIYPEQLFIDGRELWQVTSLSALKPGTWYFDYSSDKIYIADNPNGRLVETSVTATAFSGSAKNVVIRDLTIEKYATPAQMGAVHGQADRNGPHNQHWVVQGNEIRYSASAGVNFGDHMLVEANYIHNNGRLGIGSGRSENAVAKGNEIAYNCVNTGFLCFGWGGGGVKLAGSTGASLISNYVHHNYGNALAVDVQAVDSTFEGNRVVDNDGAGIFVEVSTGALVRNNTLLDNGHRRPLGKGAGIVIGSSTGVTVTGNTLTGNAAGIEGLEMNRAPGLYDLTVTGNFIDLDQGWNGLRVSSGNENFAGRNIVWDHNTYNLSNIKDPFRLGVAKLNVSQWVSQGYDQNATFN